MPVNVNRIALICFVFLTTLYAQDGLRVQPYLFLSTYDKSFKDKDQGIGVYGSYKDGVSEWKFGAEYKSTTYSSSLDFLNPDSNETTPPDTNETTPPDTNETAVYQGVTDTNETNETFNNYDNYQGSVIIGYSRKLTQHVVFDATFHYTLSDLEQADKNKVFFGALSYYNPYSYNIGMEVAYSIYNDKSLANDVMQFTPYFASWFGEPGSLVGRIYYKLAYYYIIPFQENVTLKDSYSHFKVSFFQNTENFINELAFSFGEGINLVEDKGFTVHGDNTISDKSFLFSSTYKVDDMISVRGAYIYENYSEYNPVLTLYTDSVKMSRFIVSALFRF
ncbi:MAG: hypothetical protein GXO11_07435 [Epsilonproteobacteria bacterium]|nr:hypothetical protein [Campylobacterota bacterium]